MLLEKQGVIIDNKKILEQFKKVFFKYGDFCFQPSEYSWYGECCGFWNIIENVDDKYCSFFDILLDENKRCDQCIKELGL